jgi:ABC-type lipoprotein release transport system permease subunit
MSAYCVNFAATAFPMIQGMQERNYYWIGFDKHDVSMEYTSSEGFDETVQKIVTMPEVQRIIPTTTDTGLSLAWEPGMDDTILSIMLYDTFEDLEMTVLEGRNPRYSNEIAIGNAVAEQMNKHIGDYIDVYFEGDKKMSLLICGTFQCFYDLGRSCRLLGSTLTENGVDFTYSEASIYLNKGYDLKAFLDKANAEYNNQAKFIDRSLKYDNIMNMITGPQIQAIGPFMVLALLLGGLNIIAIVYLKNKDAKKTYSIYKAIGYSSHHLMKVNLYYVLLIALASILITVPLFIFVFPKMMVLAMSFLGFKEYVVTYDVLVLILSNVGALLIYLASGLLTSKSLYENPIADLTCE